MKITHLIAACCLLLITNYGHAQENYTPDRPGIGSGTYVTQPGVFGIETGVQLSANEFVNQFDIGQMLLRIGVIEKLELRALLNSYSTQSFEQSDVSNSGFQDVGLAAKYNILTSPESGSSVSALAKISLPVGASAFSNSEVVSTAFLLADQSVSDHFAVSVNTGYTFPVGSLDGNWLLTVTPSVSIPGAEHIGVYAGYAGINNPESTDQHYIEGGATITVNDGAQLDINAGYEMENESFFIGLGFAQGFRMR